MVSESPNVALAFGLVTGAGLCTGIGAAAVFSPRLIKAASKEVLASSLAFSAGVMIYVSFVEIFQKSVLAFEEAGYPYNKAYLYGTLCFFAGCLMMKFLGFVVNRLMDSNEPSGHGHSHGCPVHFDVHAHTNVTEKEQAEHSGHNSGSGKSSSNATTTTATTTTTTTTTTATTSSSSGSSSSSSSVDGSNSDVAVAFLEQEKDTVSHQNTEEGGTVGDKKLMRMGLNTALAIAIHNFPEGLATFVGALDDPAVGMSLAFAIAMHNIPEGLCVAVPVYFSTGSRSKAFMWGILSGVTEPIGALFGWLVLASVMGQTVYGVLFGLVAGMMTMIVMRELLPTAHRYDPSDKYITNFFLVGMGVMALSLVLFTF